MSTYLITGANRGIGLEFARQLLARGDTVLAFCREPEKATDLNALASHSGVKLTVGTLDVADAASIASLPGQLQADGVKLDVLINNAGIAAGHESFGNINQETMSRVLLVNSIAPMLITQALTPLLEASGSKNPKVVCITSILGSISHASGLSLGMSYGMSKAALNMGVKQLSSEMKRRGVAILALHPGWVLTDMGGAGAQTEPADSIRGMLKVIDEMTVADNGRYLTFEGEELPW